MDTHVFLLLFVILLALVVPYLWLWFWLIEAAGHYGILVLILFVVLHLGLFAWHKLHYSKHRKAKSDTPRNAPDGKLADFVAGLLLDLLSRLFR
jgi:hypothetical protein